MPIHLVLVHSSFHQKCVDDHCVPGPADTEMGEVLPWKSLCVKDKMSIDDHSPTGVVLSQGYVLMQ